MLTNSNEDAAGAVKTTDGFALPELMISLALVLIVFGAAMSGLNSMATSQQRIWNRTQMHGGVRAATELMQQEIGQAGLVALPGNPTLAEAAVLGMNEILVSSTAGMFLGMKLAVGADENRETITVVGFPSAGRIRAFFSESHDSGAPLRLFGGFPHGIVPDNLPTAQGPSTPATLKLFGDINGDGQMVYVEYRCDWTARRLYRTVRPWNATSKPVPGVNEVLLTNVVANPAPAGSTTPTPCFLYQRSTAGTTTYITGVAITLSVETERVDPVTRQRQRETKALLNVAPRNVIHTWHLGSLGYSSRIQPTPPTIASLMSMAYTTTTTF